MVVLQMVHSAKIASDENLATVLIFHLLNHILICTVCTLLYEMASNPKGKKLCLKNILLLPSECVETYLQKFNTLILIESTRKN